MSTLLYSFQNRDPVPTDEADVRSTSSVVDIGAASAEQQHSPDWNELDTDERQNLGLTPHNLASHVDPSVQYPPWHAPGANREHNEVVNQQVSTSGTAAQREQSGQWGHGTLMVTEGIEPTIRDGAQFSNEYFSAHERDIQEGAGDYMQAANPSDPKTLAEAQATGTQHSRRAVQASQYAAYLNGFMAGA